MKVPNNFVKVSDIPNYFRCTGIFNDRIIISVSKNAIVTSDGEVPS